MFVNNVREHGQDLGGEFEKRLASMKSVAEAAAKN